MERDVTPGDDLLGERDVVVIEGPDAVSYLHSQLTQDVAAMTVGDERWTFVLEPTGKVDVLARVRRVGEARLELDTDAGFGEALLARLNRFKIRVKADLALVPAADPADDDPERERRRIAAGWPRLGREIVPGESLVAGLGLSRIAVSFTKGCYPGQELVERMDSRGAEAPRTLRRVTVGDEARPGNPVTDPATGDVVGELTSVAAPHGLAWVKRGSSVGEPVGF